MRLIDVFAHNLKAVRLKRHVSQESLASRVHLSAAYISMLERGHRSPPFQTIESLAKALDVEAVSLLSGAGRRR